MNYFNQESERLQFRKLQKEDIPIWETFFEDNDSLRFLGIDLSKSPAELAKNWIEKQWKRYENSGLGHLAIISKATGEFLGLGGIIPRMLHDRAAYEIAYSLLPQHWGKGYATELAQTMKAFAIKTQLSNQVISIIHKENHGSMNVAQKNGMTILFETHYLGMEVWVYGIEKLY